MKRRVAGRKEFIMNRRAANKRRIYLLTAVMAIVVAAFSIKGTAYCMEKPEVILSNDPYTEELEADYVSKVENVLGECGCSTAGVMLTKIMYADGHNDYTLSINHRKLKKEEAVKNEILTKIGNVEFPVENSTLLIMTMD